MTDLDKLEAMAQAATPGPWCVDPPEEGSCDDWKVRNGWESGSHTLVRTTSWNSGEKQDAAYIAACDPSTILRLVRVARAAKEALSMLEQGLCVAPCELLDGALEELEKQHV